MLKRSFSRVCRCVQKLVHRLDHELDMAEIEALSVAVNNQKLEVSGGESSRTSAMAGDPSDQLDSELWSKLPREILEQVMRRLPFPSLCRFRLVSKFWNALPTLRPEDAYLLDVPWCGQLDYCNLYSLASDRWSGISLGFLRSHMILCYIRAGSGFNPDPPKIQRSCSDGGLLCVWAELTILHDDEDINPSRFLDQHHVFVCNPLTQSCKLLPQLNFQHDAECKDLVMQRDSSSGEYKIFVTVLEHPTETDAVLRYYMYSSVSASWLLLHGRLKSKAPFLHCGIVFKDVYYFLTEEDGFLVTQENGPYLLSTTSGDFRCGRLFGYDLKQNCCFSIGFTLDLKAKEISFLSSNDRLLLLTSFTVEQEDNLSMVLFESHDIKLVRNRDAAEGAMRNSPEISDAFVSGSYTASIRGPKLLCLICPIPGKWERWFACAHGGSVFFATQSKTEYGVGIGRVDPDMEDLTFIKPVEIIPRARRPAIMTFTKTSFDLRASV